MASRAQRCTGAKDNLNGLALCLDSGSMDELQSRKPEANGGREADGSKEVRTSTTTNDPFGCAGLCPEED